MGRITAMIIIPMIVMAGLGSFLALVLAIASHYFYVKENPVLTALKAALPGINCGGCGFAGCEGAAKAVMAGKTTVTVCRNAGPEVADRLADILGQTHEFTEPGTAEPGCSKGDRGERRYAYLGLADCRAEALLHGGSLVCTSGCLGHGTCIRACPFHALHKGKNGVPEVDPALCRGCGICSRVCPKGVMSVTGTSARLIHFHQSDECLAPCRQKCPAQINIPLFLSQVRRQAYQEAVETIKERNPLVISASRVCPRPCENICRRNIADQGLAIGQIERFIGEWEMRTGTHVPLACAKDTGHKIAVVGSGPAGLSCAYFLRRLGHHPFLFEAKNQLGGMLRYGLPEYRLPNKVVDWEIQGILNMGIPVETGVELGKDFFLDDLGARGFKSVFLGLGAWIIPPLCVKGESAWGVTGSLDFLSRAGSDITRLDGIRVAVIGESNTAMDCARTCIRLKADFVSVICPSDYKHMSARKRDVQRAMEEGVDIRFLTLPSRICSDLNNRVTGLAYHAMAPGTDGSEDTGPGTDQPGTENDLPGSQTVLDVQLIIAAYERKPDLEYLLHDPRLKDRFRASSRGNLAADPDTLMAARPNVFAAGDLYTGRSTVINAIADGRKAARSIHLQLTCGQVTLPPKLLRKLNTDSILKQVHVAQHIPKIIVPEIPAHIRIQSLSRDIVGSITQPQAQNEAKRCLRCGTTCYDT